MIFTRISARLLWMGLAALALGAAALLIGSCSGTETSDNRSSLASSSAAQSNSQSNNSDDTQESASPNNTQDKVTLRVLFAGSLIIPFGELESEFEQAYPNIDLNMEGHGSIQAIRIVSDLHEKADLIVSADHQLIPMLLYASTDPDTGSALGQWTITFASNKMVVVYGPDSLYAHEADAGGDWTDIINRPGVRLGISDPRLDANGYRALMMIKLAETLLDQPDLFARTFAGAFRVPVRATTKAEGTVISVPEILETVEGSHLILRPYSVNLLPLVKSGDIDYAFEYESVARQHQLKAISLPPELNLGDPAYNSFYDDVTVKLDFQRFASVKPEFTGEAIRYGVTIPSNAPHPEEAATLLAFLLGSDGQRIMADNYQPMVSPFVVDNFDLLPDRLKPLCAPTE